MDKFTNNENLNTVFSKKSSFDTITIPTQETFFSKSAATNDQSQITKEEVDFDSIYSEVNRKLYSNSVKDKVKVEYYKPEFVDNYFNKYADINGDGKINNADIKALQKAIAEGKESKYDINGDGELSIVDVSMLQSYISGAKFSDNNLDLSNNENIKKLIKSKVGNLKNGDLEKIMENKTLINAFLDIGKTIEDFPSSNNFHDGNWCADFVSQKLVESGVDIKKSAVAGDGPGEILDVLKDKGAKIHYDSACLNHRHCSIDDYEKDYSPQPGDIIVFDRDHDGINDHTGFVVKDNGDGTITTIEGNTSGPEGNSCVAVHEEIDRSQVFAYASLSKKDKDKK